ncbi:MAG TPA: protein jag [Firmicutes bacterium]|nr:protein jag [Bacillota bacterium]HHY97384.1 protein jag [Bacillota bacterium]
MKAVEKTGRTVEEATRAALNEMGLSRDEVDVQVLEEGTRGFLGFAARPAKVLVIPRAPRPEERVENSISRAKRFLEGLLDQMHMSISEIKTEQIDGAVRFNISGGQLGNLIGRRGQTLDAIQYLVNLVASRTLREDGGLPEGEDRIRFVVDAQGYRHRREDALRSLALRVADRVKRDGRRIALEPMTPMERRVVHLALQNIEGVSCHSEGEEPRRRIVISPVGPRRR